MDGQPDTVEDNFQPDDLQPGEDGETLSVEEAQKAFDDAFIAGQQSDSDSKKGNLDISVTLAVKDNENNVLPSELEQLTGRVKAEWDFVEITKATGSILMELSFNQSSKPNFAFYADLADQQFQQVLQSFDENTARFLGIEDILGGPEGVAQFRTDYIGKESIIELTDEQMKEIARSFETANEQGDIVVNTAEEEEAIVQAFIKSKVVEVVGGSKSDDTYLLEFKTTGEPIVNFLNKVAEINDLERDFSGDLKNFDLMDITGSIKVTNNKITLIDTEIFAQKGLIEDADKDFVINIIFESVSEKAGKWTVKLIDSFTSEEQARLEVDYQTK